MIADMSGAFKSLIVFVVIISAVVGWALIELLIWLFSKITIVWG